MAECAAICDANALCLAFEYGVDYGGDGEYEAGDCQEQSSAEVTDCDGASYNLDLYVKDQPAAGSLAPGYTRLPMTCVDGQNIGLHAGKTVAECASICDANALCLAFEYGIDYGGGGEYEARDCQEQSSVVLNGCDGAHHNLDLFVKDQSSSSLDDATIREAVAAWLADAAVAEAAYGHISTWKTGGVTDMANLFCAHETNGDCAWQWNDHAVPRTAAASFNEDISAWDTSGVTTMARMFHVASSFNQPLGGWQVDKVTNMNFMFGEASAFNQDIGDWALDSVTYMQWMFADASAFDQDLGWCLYEVNFGYAFSGTLCQPTSCGVSSCAPTSAPTAFDGKFYDSNINALEQRVRPISTWDTSRRCAPTSPPVPAVSRRPRAFRHLGRYHDDQDVLRSFVLQPGHRQLGGPQRSDYEGHVQQGLGVQPRHRRPDMRQRGLGLRPGPRLVRGRRRVTQRHLQTDARADSLRR